MGTMDPQLRKLLERFTDNDPPMTSRELEKLHTLLRRRHNKDTASTLLDLVEQREFEVFDQRINKDPSALTQHELERLMFIAERQMNARTRAAFIVKIDRLINKHHRR